MGEDFSESIHIADESFRLQHLRSDMPELSQDLIKAFSECFRTVFANPPHGQFLFYPSEGRAISAQEAFQRKEMISIEEIQSYDREEYPKHPSTRESASFWVDPDKTIEVFQEKMRSNAFLSLCRNSPAKDLVGASFAYETNLGEVFSHEEWEDDHLYSTQQDPTNFRSKSQFLRRIKEEAADFFDFPKSISSKTAVLCCNCIFLIPEYQGRGIGYQIQERFLKQLPKESLEMPLIAEVVLGTTIAKRATSLGKAKIVTGILNAQDSTEDGERVIIISKGRFFLEALETLHL